LKSLLGAHKVSYQFIDSGGTKKESRLPAGVKNTPRVRRKNHELTRRRKKKKRQEGCSFVALRQRTTWEPPGLKEGQSAADSRGKEKTDVGEGESASRTGTEIEDFHGAKKKEKKGLHQLAHSELGGGKRRGGRSVLEPQALRSTCSEKRLGSAPM